MTHDVRVAWWTILVLNFAGACAPACAQVFEFTGGSSSLIHARGGSIRIYGGDYTARMGVGVRDHRGAPQFGAQLGFGLIGLAWELGDEDLTLGLPTDVLGGTMSFPGRGIAVSRATRAGSVRIFGGATSTGFSTPYFQTADARTPAGLVFVDRQLMPKLRGISRNVVSTRWSSIHGLEWSPRPSTKGAVVGGIGGDEPYGAGSLEVETPRFTMRTSYTARGAGFRRLPTDEFATSENDRENVLLEFMPRGRLRFSVGRQHYAALFSGAVTRSTLSSAGAGASILGLQVNGSASLSETGSGSTLGYTAGAARAVRPGLDVQVGWYGTDDAVRRGSQVLVARLRESLGPRLMLNQSVATGTRTHLSWGGRLDLGHLLVSLDHQMTFLPLAPRGRSAFQQVEMFQLRAPLPGGLRMNVATQVDPAGHVRYTAYATCFAYGRPISTGAAARRDDFASWLIRGTVVDTAGNPVSGAAVRLGGELAYSDSYGRIEVRKPKKREYVLEVVLDEFMFPGVWEVIAAPAMVHASAEGSVRDFRVVLRRR